MLVGHLPMPVCALESDTSPGSTDHASCSKMQGAFFNLERTTDGFPLNGFLAMPSFDKSKPSYFSFL